MVGESYLVGVFGGVLVVGGFGLGVFFVVLGDWWLVGFLVVVGGVGCDCWCGVDYW